MAKSKKTVELERSHEALTIGMRELLSIYEHHPRLPDTSTEVLLSALQSHIYKDRAKIDYLSMDKNALSLRLRSKEEQCDQLSNERDSLKAALDNIQSFRCEDINKYESRIARLTTGINKAVERLRKNRDDMRAERNAHRKTARTMARALRRVT